MANKTTSDLDWSFEAFNDVNYDSPVSDVDNSGNEINNYGRYLSHDDCTSVAEDLTVTNIEASQDKSLRLLDEIESVLATHESSATKLHVGNSSVHVHNSSFLVPHHLNHTGTSDIGTQTESINSNDPQCPSYITQTSIYCNTGVQTTLETDYNSSVISLKDKCDNLEKCNINLVRDIELLQDKINSDKKTFKELLQLKQIDIEFYQCQREDLLKKVSTLEDIIRMGLVSSTQPSLSPATTAFSTCTRVDHSSNLSKFHESGTKNKSKKVNEGIANTPISPAKLKILADSHGRGLCHIMRSKGLDKVFGLIKPGAKSNDILGNFVTGNIHTNSDEFLLLLAGSNDVYCNDSKKFLRLLKKFLVTHHHSKVIVCTIPMRYDLPIWSLINREILQVNNKIMKLGSIFNNLRVLDIGNLGRRFHTLHGLHFNILGKNLICESIMLLMENLSEELHVNQVNPIPLPWLNTENQGNL